MIVALDAQWSAVARGYRVVLILAGAVGFAAVVACALTGYALAGLFICVGLGLGGWNSRRLWADTQKLVDGSPSEPVDEDEPTAGPRHFSPASAVPSGSFNVSVHSRREFLPPRPRPTQMKMPASQ